MTDYEILKGKGKTMWCVRADEDVMRFYSKHECEAWIARDKRHAADHAVFAAEEAKARLASVKAYLETRAARKAATPEQFSLFA